MTVGDRICRKSRKTTVSSIIDNNWARCCFSVGKVRAVPILQSQTDHRVGGRDGPGEGVQGRVTEIYPGVRTEQ